MIKEEIIEEFSDILKESGISMFNGNMEQENYLKLLNTKPLRTLLPSQKIISKNTPTKTKNIQIQSNPNSRGWKILQTSLVKCIENLDDTFSKIEIRTRSDQPSLDVMPERLYSSLKYEVTQEISSAVCSSAVIMCKIEVVNPFDSDEIITKQGGKPVLKGTTELIPLTMNSNKSILYSKTKLQFLSVSFHHENKYFAFKFSYFYPENLEQPILVQLSAPFQVFARRPRRKISKKRTKKEMEEDMGLEEKSEKKIKKEHITESPQTIILTPKNNEKANLNEFLTCLEVLLTVKGQLTKEDQQVAEEHIQNHLLAYTRNEQEYSEDQNDNNEIVVKEEQFDETFNIDNYTNFEEMSSNLDFGNNLF